MSSRCYISSKIDFVYIVILLYFFQSFLAHNLTFTGKIFILGAFCLFLAGFTASQVDFKDSNGFDFYNELGLYSDLSVEDGNISMNNNRILGLPEPTSSGEPLTQGSGSGDYVDRTGDSMSGDLDLQDNFLLGNNGEIDFSSGEMILDQQMPNSGSPTTLQINQDGTAKWALVSMQDGGLGIYDAEANEIVQEFNENGVTELKNRNTEISYGNLGIGTNNINAGMQIGGVEGPSMIFNDSEGNVQTWEIGEGIISNSGEFGINEIDSENTGSDIVFNTSGSVNVPSGDLDIGGNDLTSTDYILADGNKVNYADDIDLRGNNLRLEGGYLSGDGDNEGINVESDGTVNIEGGNLDMNNANIDNLNTLYGNQFRMGGITIPAQGSEDQNVFRGWTNNGFYKADERYSVSSNISTNCGGDLGNLFDRPSRADFCSDDLPGSVLIEGLPNRQWESVGVHFTNGAGVGEMTLEHYDADRNGEWQVADEDPNNLGSEYYLFDDFYGYADKFRLNFSKPDKTDEVQMDYIVGYGQRVRQGKYLDRSGDSMYGELNLKDGFNVQEGQFQVQNDGQASYDVAGTTWGWKVDDNGRVIWDIRDSSGNDIWSLAARGPGNELVIEDGSNNEELLAIDDEGNVDLRGGNLTSVDQVEGHMERRGRVCPQDHYLYQGYCAEKDLHYEPKDSCSTGELTRGVCEEMFSYGNVYEAWDTCDSNGGRLPTPAELDRIDGTGKGWDGASVWVQVAEDSGDINSRNVGIGAATRYSRQLNAAPLDQDKSGGNDDIAAVEYKDTQERVRDEFASNTGGELNAIHCVYD